MFRTLVTKSFKNFSKYIRDRSHLSVGTVGHLDHGKTTLTAAINKMLSKSEKTKTDPPKGMTTNNSTSEYVTDKRRYTHVDCPGSADYVKSMIMGAANMDIAILVVSAKDGCVAQTREHILLCKQVGVKSIVVFLNKIDIMTDEEMHEIVEMEIRELLTKYEFDGDNAKIIKGSALMAFTGENPAIGTEKIIELLKVMDSIDHQPEKLSEKSFLLSVYAVNHIEGRGLVVYGGVEQGKVKVGDEVEIIGYEKESRKTIVTAIETFRKSMDYAQPGDSVEMFVRGLTKKQVQRGQIVCKVGSLKNKICVEATVKFLTENDGGRKDGFSTGYRPQIFMRTGDMAVDLVLPKSVRVGMPGDVLNLQLRLSLPYPVNIGMRFVLRESGKTIGYGDITGILEDDAIPANIAMIAKAERETEDDENR